MKKQCAEFLNPKDKTTRCLLAADHKGGHQIPIPKDVWKLGKKATLDLLSQKGN